jgi:hypothetical protein
MSALASVTSPIARRSADIATTIHAGAMQMFRFPDGKIVASWGVRDDLGTLRQLGYRTQPRASLIG